VRRHRHLVTCLLLACVTGASGAQQGELSGTWTAKNANGLVLMGTWTAAVDTASGGVVGTWTLVDGRGRTLANGGWAAAKARALWSGAWRANIAGRDGAYSGAWSARVDLEREAPLAELFASAVRSVVTGTWQSAGRSGGWSIRTTARTGSP
jgi:hypothetical protein